MLHQPSRGIRDADLLAQLQRGNPFLVLAHAVDRPEPTGEGSAGLVKNGARGDRTLIPALRAFMDTPTGHVPSTTAAAARSGALHTGPRRQSMSGIRSPSYGFSFQPTRFFHKRYNIAFCSPDQAWYSSKYINLPQIVQYADQNFAMRDGVQEFRL